jgi:hypothetical protein
MSVSTWQNWSGFIEHLCIFFFNKGSLIHSFTYVFGESWWLITDYWYNHFFVRLWQCLPQTDAAPFLLNYMFQTSLIFIPIARYRWVQHESLSRDQRISVTVCFSSSGVRFHMRTGTKNIGNEIHLVDVVRMLNSLRLAQSSTSSPRLPGGSHFLCFPYTMTFSTECLCKSSLCYWTKYKSWNVLPWCGALAGV